MEYVIIGGDDRFAYLARMLSERGRGVTLIGRDADETVTAATTALRRAENVVTNCPPRWRGEGMGWEELLAATPESARFYLCGPSHPSEAGENVFDLWTDEALILENARLTAEGAVASAMRAGSCCLRDMRCMIIGWGRIGRALTEMMVALGVRVTVASRQPAGRSRAAERGAETVDTAAVGAALPGHRLVFNTAPGLVLDADALSHAERDAMLIDLASPPYGIDLHAAWSLGLRAWREPGLPGRYCPQSAARALLMAMDRRDRL